MKNNEWEDLKAKSSTNTRMRRSVGLSGEKELHRNGRRAMRVSRITGFDIAGSTMRVNSRISEGLLYNFSHLVGVIL